MPNSESLFVGLSKTIFTSQNIIMLMNILIQQNSVAFKSQQQVLIDEVAHGGGGLYRKIYTN